MTQTDERARFWSECECFDAATREEAKRIAMDEEEKLRCFGQTLSFGTGGLRGLLGVGTNRMNPYTVARATQGLADTLLLDGAKNVAIAYDSRIGSSEFADVAACVFAQNGLTAHVYPHLMPTPLLSYALRFLDCDAGIVITASHNPAKYNGYKVYGADGCQITDQAAAVITAAIEQVQYEDLAWGSVEQAITEGRYLPIGERVLEAYLKQTLACRMTKDPVDTLSIVYTPLYGTGLEPVRRVFDAIGAAKVYEVEEQCAPNGLFPTAPFPNPEEPKALALALGLAQEKGADIVLATDPDCDRVGVAVREATGKYDLLSGNEVGLLLMDYLLSKRKAQGKLPEGAVVIKTIVTSDLALSIAAEYDVQVYEVLTGFKYIGEWIGRLEEEGRAEQFIFGFEESCGYLAGTHVRDKDGVMAVMLIADMAQHYLRQGKTLRDAMQALYQRHGTIGTKLVSANIQDALPMQRMAEVMEGLRTKPPEEIAGAKVINLCDYRHGINGLPRADVLVFETERRDKVIVRPSGTEPKIKLYLSAYGTSKAVVEARLQEIVEAIVHWM